MDDDLTPIWKALSDPTRRTILDLLKQRPRTTGELSDTFAVSRFAVMKHLNVLAEADLIVVRRQGRQRWNHLNAVPLQRIYERWLRPYEAEWATSLLKLKEISEEKDAMTEKIISAGGVSTMQIEQEVTIQAPPERVFDALTRETSFWYSDPYLNTKTERVILEPVVGGRFYEDWGDGEGVLLATVVTVNRPGKLRMVGPMGLSGPVAGDIHISLEADGDATRLKLSHRAVGQIEVDMERQYEVGWADLLGTRLKALAEGNKGAR